ncbi:MAG TPA: DNA primase [Xanthobacteraceae bacterium]|uniref:DNA primase n=1 Tax=Roseixanthobacter finlandensis TaxID=3119922 RepID=UPI000BC495AC|nr:MAG: DNA primase [Rhizobiales bacterium 12-66-7]OZB07047.1 MAG: DNA primase [Rhizobiales bacterium 39-66-18]HQS10261.1 DNA primase [Xanthobacteraceae bacterium]
MRFPPSFLDEIRARLPVSEVVGRRVKLKKQGREFAGLSPFNAEKTPSFFVNDQKGFYHCFSSGKHGDVFDFLMETEGLPFAEAVERLASMAGLALPQVTPEAAAKEERRRSLHDVMALAARYFEDNLQARAGAKARGYLADRDLGPTIQKRFHLGYAAPDRYALKEALGKAGVSVADMVETGLLIAGDDIPVPYDRFRDRVMFPITDLKGRVVAFGGRALEKDVAAKYLNSPETVLFHKGSLLYNGFSARAAVHKGARVIAVEGYVDVIAMVEAGFEGTVAPLGTALTEDQLQLLWRMAEEPVLLFDGDKAGRRAAFRAIDLALPHLKPGRSLSFGMLPEGQDPDDLIRRSGRDAMEAVLARAEPLAAMLWARELEGANLETPERRAALEARIGEVVSTIADENVRRHYRQDLNERLKRLLSPPREARGFVAAGRARNPDMRGGRFKPREEPLVVRGGGELSRTSLIRGPLSSLPRGEALLLFCLLNHPWLMDENGEDIAELPFANADADTLRRALLDAHMEGKAGDSQSLAHQLEKMGVEALSRRARAVANPRMDWPAYPDTGAEDVRLWWSQCTALHRKAYALSRELREAERSLGDDPSEANFAWLRDVRERLSAVEGTEALVEGFGASSGRGSARSV